MGFLRRNLLVPVPSFGSMAELNRSLAEGCARLNASARCRDGRPSGEALREDLSEMRALPGVAFDAVRWVPVRADKRGYVEVDGREYFFVDLDQFKEMVENDELLEHATYVANSYGTPRKFVEEKLDSGLDVLLDIEVQGARQINEKKPDAVKIFIIPPSLAELRRRLVGRGTDTERAIEARLIRARQEYAEADFYDYIIINDDPDRAAKELAAIMLAERCKAEGRMHFLRDAIEE